MVYGLNRAVQTDRSSGSTAKPIMDYGPAIQYLKWPTYYALSDTKFTFPGTNTVLHDFDNQYMGTMTMRTALVESRNVPAVRTLQAVGISRATKFLKGLGISQKSAYTLANGIGLYVSPTANRRFLRRLCQRGNLLQAVLHHFHYHSGWQHHQLQQER